ncbi:MAG: peptidase M19 [Candidatus Hydrogenedentes bacterium]|nr:peptidase M19 [Candidatus Hydrogenedentota bacterium]
MFLRTMNRSRLKKPYFISSHAQDLHRRLSIADLHCDALLSNRDLLAFGHRGHVDIPRLFQGNIALQFFSIPTLAPVRAGIPWLPSDTDALKWLLMTSGWPPNTHNSTFQRVLYAAQLLQDTASRSVGLFRIIKSRKDLDAFLRDRQTDPRLTAGILGVEGLHSLEDHVDNLQRFFDAGVRTAGLVHLHDNALGGSAHGHRREGLSDFGLHVLRWMESHHMLVDLAHSSSRLLESVLAQCTRPLIISHTGLYGAYCCSRNISDAHAREVARKRGVIGIGFFPWAIGACSMGALFKSLAYAVDLVGSDHVALGSDWDGMVTTPFDASGMGLVTDMLLHRGFSEADIAKIMGGNVFRVLRETLPDR